MENLRSGEISSLIGTENAPPREMTFWTLVFYFLFGTMTILYDFIIVPMVFQTTAVMILLRFNTLGFNKPDWHLNYVHWAQTPNFFGQNIPSLMRHFFGMLSQIISKLFFFVRIQWDIFVSFHPLCMKSLHAYDNFWLTQEIDWYTPVHDHDGR